MPLASIKSYPLSAIQCHPRLQVRGGTNFQTVKRYAKLMKEGVQFPPIRLAEVGNNVYVIDGHHRLEAAARARRQTIDGTKHRMSITDAHLQALAANGDHGRNLTQKEKRACLQGYVDQGVHLDEFGTVKSLRTIHAECPVYSVGHLGKMLKAMNIDAPRAGVKPYDRHLHEPTEDELAEDEDLRWHDFQRHLDAAMAALALLDDVRRDKALASIRSLLDDLTPPPPIVNPLDV